MNRWYTMLALAVVCLTLPAPFIAGADYEQDGAITVDLPTTGDLLTLDPLFGADHESVTIIENLFVGLTDVDPATGDILPELARDWTVSDDGQVWTFILRQDIYWVQHDPVTDQTRLARQVVASDVVYSIQRACDPRLSEHQLFALTDVVAGCDVLRNMPQITDDEVYGDIVQTTAPDDFTLVIRLQYPAQYFLTLTTTIRPVPVEVIETYGADWTQPGNIMTNGAFVRGQEWVYLRNDYYPKSLHHGGNIERVVYHIIEDNGTRLSLYDENVIDMTDVDGIYLEGVLNNDAYFRQVVRIFDLQIYYFAFSHDLPPFDNVHVRRAFSAILDRQRFVEELRWGRGIPMTTLTPALVLPYLGEEGVGFDPNFAQQELARGGFPDCQGLPTIQLYAPHHTEAWGAFLVASAEEYLGCEVSAFRVHDVETTSAHIKTADWYPLYRDPHHWLGDLLACNGFLSRGCSDIDLLLHEAAAEPNPDRRAYLYHQIEAAFFGERGEQPIAPLFLEAGSFLLIKPWYTGPFITDGQFGGRHWDAYNVNIRLKLATANQ